MAFVCGSCGFDNPPKMRFCGNCGSKLANGDDSTDLAPSEFPERIPVVASQNRPDTDPEKIGILTGSDLLERFRKAGLEASGQRRSVTILFVDLSGYTQLSEKLGDEELFNLVQRFISLLVKDVYQYEGMVDKLTGDGLMALFGAPVAYENNAERAILSAFDMLDDVAKLSQELNLGENRLQIHVGLNSGSVIVGGVGGDGLMNYTAIGDSVNLARRLEEKAEPGMILVSESVYQQTSRQFRFKKLPPARLKNISKEVIPFQVLSPNERQASMRGVDGLRAPMIGRENEYNQVAHRVNRLIEERDGGVILLVGEGGMGKSRLTSEMKQNLDRSRLFVLEGQSLTYRKSIAYWIFQDLMRNFLGISADASESAVRQKLAHFSSDVFGDEGVERLPYLEHLFSLQPSDPNASDRLRYLDPGQLRQQVFLTYRDFLVNIANRQPVMIILEDLHWADDASLDLIRFLIDSTRSAAILIYAITRPFEGGAVQAIHDRAQQRLGDRYELLRLQALPPDQSAQLLQALLSIQELPEKLRTQIIQRSAGLPFYLEEILRMMIERGIITQDNGAWHLMDGADSSAVGVPETLQGLILTRFDRLTTTQRKLLQTASVVGYQFSYLVMSQVLLSQVDGITSAEIREALRALTEREFIYPQLEPERNDDSSANEQVYQFKHVLVSDAVYSTLLQRDRRELHTRVGEAIERIYSSRLEGYIEVLAGHFLRSPYLDRALHYLIQSGQKAAHSYANEQALQLYGQALDLLPKTEHTPEQAQQVHSGLGDALITAGEYSEARDHYVLALDAAGIPAKTAELRSLEEVLSTRITDRTHRVQLISQLQRKISKTHESQGEYDKALLYLQSAQQVLQSNETALSLEQASILNETGWIYFRRGNMDEAEALLNDGLGYATRAGQLDVTASILNRLAGIYYQRDLVEKAASYVQQSLKIREQIGDVVAVARSYNNLGLINWKQGQLQSALDNFNRSFQLQANLGDVEGLIVLHTNIGLIEIDRGNLLEAQQHFQEALQTSAQIGHYYHVCTAYMHMALLNVYNGNWSAAVEYGQQSMAGFQELGVKENQLDILVSLGWAYLGLSDEQKVNDYQQRIRVLLAEDESRPGGRTEGQGRAYRLLARIASERGDLSGAKGLLETSVEIFTQLANSLERSRSLVDLGNLLTAYGRMEEARLLFFEARMVFERMGAALELTKMQLIEKNLSAN